MKYLWISLVRLWDLYAALYRSLGEVKKEHRDTVHAQWLSPRSMLLRSQFSPNWSKELVSCQSKPSRLFCRTRQADFKFVWKRTKPRIDKITENKQSWKAHATWLPRIIIKQQSWTQRGLGADIDQNWVQKQSHTDMLNYFPNMPRGINGKK